MITFIDRNGPPEAMLCPAILCDTCGRPIDHSAPHGTDDGEDAHGWVIWHPGYPDDEKRPTIDCLHHVHGGICDRRMDAACGRNHWSRSLDQFLRQLANNYEHPIVEEPGVEYVAPAPSTWRLGRYERS